MKRIKGLTKIQIREEKNIGHIEEMFPEVLPPDAVELAKVEEDQSISINDKT